MKNGMNSSWFSCQFFPFGIDTLSVLTLQKCFFPQNLRSFGYKSVLPRFHAFHPYLGGGHDGSDGALARFDGGHRCGVLVNNFQYKDLASRKLAPTTQFAEWVG